MAHVVFKSWSADCRLAVHSWNRWSTWFHRTVSTPVSSRPMHGCNEATRFLSTFRFLGLIASNAVDDDDNFTVATVKCLQRISSGRPPCIRHALHTYMADSCQICICLSKSASIVTVAHTSFISLFVLKKLSYLRGWSYPSKKNCLLS